MEVQLSQEETEGRTRSRDRLAELRIDRDEAPVARRRGPLLGLAAALALAAVVVGWWVSRPVLDRVEVVPAVGAGGGVSGAPSVLDASGYVTARRQATVSSKVTGKIVEVAIEEGVRVKRGDVLARLDTSTIEIQVDVARAQLASSRSSLAETEVRLDEARINLRRTRRLVEADARSASDLDSDQAAADALEARLVVGRRELAVAERVLALRLQELEDRIIRAPFDGVVVTKNAQPGEMISPVSAGGGFTRTGVCTVVDMSSLEIEVDVNEAYINRVRPGQRVRATLDAYPDWRIPATVITPVPTADRQKATVRIRIAFDALDPRILPDMGIKVTFLGNADVGANGNGEAAHALVPSAALRDDDGRPVVFVFDSGALERRAVRLGSRRGDQVEIVAGVAVGERVVVSGPPELRDGDRVMVR